MLHGRELISTELWRRWTGDQARWTRVDDASFSSPFFVSSRASSLFLWASCKKFVFSRALLSADNGQPSSTQLYRRPSQPIKTGYEGDAWFREKTLERGGEGRGDGISGRWINQREWGVFQFVFENFFLWKMIIVGSNAMKRLKIEGFVMVTRNFCGNNDVENLIVFVRIGILSNSI